MSRARRLIGLVLAGALTTGCWEQVSKGWFASMKEQPAVQALEEEPFAPPAGTVPVGGFTLTVADDHPMAMTPMFVPEARTLENPFPRTRESMARGKEVYTVYCAVCHGSDGMAGHAERPVARRLAESGAPPFPLSTTVAYTDGMLYAKILYGRPLMPGYPQIAEDDRWHAVNYLRELFPVPGQ